MDRRGDVGEKEGKRQHLASDRMGGPTPGLRVCVISFLALRFTTALFGRSLRRARAAALTRPRLLSSQLLARCLGNRRRLVRTAETAAGQDATATASSGHSRGLGAGAGWGQ